MARITQTYRHSSAQPSPAERHRAVIANPHIADWYFTYRWEKFLQYYFIETLHAEYWWYRYEFQGRGSIHIHGVCRLASDPGLTKLASVAFNGWIAKRYMIQKGDTRYKLEPEHIPKDTFDLAAAIDKLKLTNAAEDAFIKVIDEGDKAEQQIVHFVENIGVTTFNPADMSQPQILADPHPSSRVFTEIKDLDDDYKQLMPIEHHTKCGPTCIRQKHHTMPCSVAPNAAASCSNAQYNQVECFFGFPQATT